MDTYEELFNDLRELSHDRSLRNIGHGGVSVKKLRERIEQIIARNTHKPTTHDCATCTDCVHDGHKCCGCYDGACCQETDLQEHVCNRNGELDRSICGACGGAYVACTLCTAYNCECTDQSSAREREELAQTVARSIYDMQGGAPDGLPLVVLAGDRRIADAIYGAGWRRPPQRP